MENDFETFDRLSDTLFRAHRARIARLLHDNDISHTQALTLKVLHEEQSATMSHLATQVGLSPGALTSTVERMVELGWVDRHRVEGDRRTVRVALTPAGAARIAEILTAKSGLARGIYAQLTPEEQAVLNRAMSLLSEAGDRFDAATP